MPSEQCVFSDPSKCSRSYSYDISNILLNDLQRFFSVIETDKLTASNSEIITLFFTVSKKNVFMK